MRDIRGLHEAAYLLGLFAILSQLLGLVRDRILAHIFGATQSLDVYYASFRIPDLIFASVASIVSVSVLIPFLAQYIEGDPKRLRAFINSIFSFFSFLIIGVSIAVFFLIPQILSVLFPSIALSDLSDDFILLTRILLLSPILLGLSNFFGSITQVRRAFFLYGLSPFLYNSGIILGILLFYPAMGIPGLGLGVVLGALLHMGMQLPILFREKLFPRFTFTPNYQDVFSVVKLSLPRTITLSIHHVTLLILIMFSARIGEGIISVFNLSSNLQSVLLSIVGVSYSVAAFPTLARLFSNGDQVQFFEKVSTAARHIIFWSLPGAILFIVLRAQIVRVILGSGSFDWTATRLTAAALAIFSVSLIAQGLSLLFVRGYYASGKTFRPLLVNLCGGVVAVGSAYGLWRLFENVPVVRYFFESLLKVSDLPGTAVLMLPLGYSVGMIVNALLFWIIFQRDFSKFSHTLFRTFFQSLAASVVMGFVAYQVLNILGTIFNLNTLLGIFFQGFIAGMVGIIAGIGILRILGNPELGEAIRAFRQRFWKSAPIYPEQKEL